MASISTTKITINLKDIERKQKLKLMKILSSILLIEDTNAVHLIEDDDGDDRYKWCTNN